jgi:hypothetical protein
MTAVESRHQQPVEDAIVKATDNEKLRTLLPIMVAVSFVKLECGPKANREMRSAVLCE